MKYVLVLQGDEYSLSPSKYYYVGENEKLNISSFNKDRKKAAIFNNKRKATQAAKILESEITGSVYIEKA